MKLILASEYFNDKIAKEMEALLGSSLSQKRVALIPNASEGDGMHEMVHRKMQEFSKYNSLLQLVDLVAYDRALIIKLLLAADVVVITGGFVSKIMNAIDAKNLREFFLTEIFPKKVYMGNSTGAMCLCKTQHLAHKYIGEEDVNAENVEGFGVVDFEVYPHFQMHMLEDVKKLVPDEIKAYGLEEGEAIIIDGGETRFTGNEILLK